MVIFHLWEEYGDSEGVCPTLGWGGAKRDIDFTFGDVCPILEGLWRLMGVFLSLGKLCAGNGVSVPPNSVGGGNEGMYPSLRENCLSHLGDCGVIRNLPSLWGGEGGGTYTGQGNPAGAPFHAQRKSLRERWLMDGAEGHEGPEDATLQDPQSPEGQAQARIQNLEDSLFT